MILYVDKEDTMNHIRRLFYDLCTLEEKIHKHLEEVLLRRDYIRYKCKFWPGEKPST